MVRSPDFRQALRFPAWQASVTCEFEAAGVKLSFTVYEEPYLSVPVVLAFGKNLICLSSAISGYGWCCQCVQDMMGLGAQDLQANWIHSALARGTGPCWRHLLTFKLPDLHSHMLCHVNDTFIKVPISIRSTLACFDHFQDLGLVCGRPPWLPAQAGWHTLPVAVLISLGWLHFCRMRRGCASFTPGDLLVRLPMGAAWRRQAPDPEKN